MLCSKLKLIVVKEITRTSSSVCTLQIIPSETDHAIDVLYFVNILFTRLAPNEEVKGSHDL